MLSTLALVVVTGVFTSGLAVGRGKDERTNATRVWDVHRSLLAEERESVDYLSVCVCVRACVRACVSFEGRLDQFGGWVGLVWLVSR